MARREGSDLDALAEEKGVGSDDEVVAEARLSRADPQAYDESARERLRVLSLNLIGLR